MSISNDVLQRLARRGAELRITELRAELAAIEQLLTPRGTGGADASAARMGSPAGTRRVRGWNAAQRKAAAERMRAYWAKRRSSARKPGR